MKMAPSLGSRFVPKAFADADWQAMKLVAERAKFRMDEIQARIAYPWRSLRHGSLEREDYVLSSRATLGMEGTWERQGTVMGYVRLQ